jgi:hypothetical protein
VLLYKVVAAIVEEGFVPLALLLGALPLVTW